MFLHTISWILFVVMFLLALILLVKEKPWVKREKYPEGYWMGVGLGTGIGICMPLGLLLGYLMENIPIGVALGPVLGAGLGSILGSRWEKQHGDPSRMKSSQHWVSG